MNTREFEQAIDDMGGELLKVNSDQQCMYGSFGNLNYVKWDANGRAYVFSIEEDHEDCVSGLNLEFLPYERDPKFDIIL